MRDLYFCGDIHGEFRTLVWTALEKYRIKNSDIIVLGDFGMGFDKKIWSLTPQQATMAKMFNANDRISMN